MPDISLIIWSGSISHTQARIIYYIQAKWLVLNRCLANLTYVCDTSADTLFDLDPMLHGFANIFPIELFGPP